MKKYFSGHVSVCACLLLAVCLMTPQYAAADPPQDLILTYNLQKQTLTVTITHPSSFTGLHYVNQVKINKNNVLVEKNDYKSQPDKKSFVYTYKIPAVPNDILEVTANCNIQGSKTATLKVVKDEN
ncbi:MAG: putative rane protein [Deltaproteobacteria bacterium]|nr:putative rane protein [Deltaproteobacteria bacterium]